MYIEFRHREGGYIKQWPNWTGEIPMVGDIVVIHYGDDKLLPPTVTERKQGDTKLW